MRVLTGSTIMLMGDVSLEITTDEILSITYFSSSIIKDIAVIIKFVPLYNFTILKLYLMSQCYRMQYKNFDVANKL